MMTAAPLERLPDPRPLIGDRRIDGASGGEYQHLYAATGTPTARVPLGGAREMDLAVTAAAAALPTWRAMAAHARRDALLRLGRLVVEHAAELSALQTLESAVPKRFADTFPALAAEHLFYNAGWIDKLGGEVVGFDPSRAFTYTVDEPYGVVAVIIPWNASLISVGQLLGPVLAAGNAAVLKPSELAPFVSLRVAELALQAGIPPGTVNVVPGAAAGGDALVRHGGIAKVHFTGSSATARTILAAAAERLTPVSLELGGKSALLIFADADIPAAVQQALSGAVALSGQGCTNGTRVLVESAIYEQVLLLARGMMRRIVVGDPFDAATLMGPVVSAAACERIVDTIDRARTSGAARLVSGGHRLDGALADGYFIAPTAFADVDRDSELAREEIFGPVLAFSSFVGEEDAVELANATRYGLAAYVHTRDARRMHRVAGALVAGSVWVNGTEGLAAAAPFGGMKESGFGRVGGRAGIREFTQTKSVWVATAQPG